MSPVEIGGWQDHGGTLHDGAPEPGDAPYSIRAFVDSDEGERWFTILEPFPDWDDLYELEDWISEWFSENYGEFA